MVHQIFICHIIFNVHAFPSYLFIFNGYFMCHPVGLVHFMVPPISPGFNPSSTSCWPHSLGQVPLPGCSSASFCSLWDNKASSHAPSPGSSYYQVFVVSINGTASARTRFKVQHCLLDTGLHHSEPVFLSLRRDHDNWCLPHRAVGR